MRVLIVQSARQIGRLWELHLQRQGMDVVVADNQDEAITSIGMDAPNIIVLDLVLKRGSALAIADYANYRVPSAQVIFVTNKSFFSDGSIFSHATNARALVPRATPPSDLVAMVEHYAAVR